MFIALTWQDENGVEHDDTVDSHAVPRPGEAFEIWQRVGESNHGWQRVEKTFEGRVQDVSWAFEEANIAGQPDRFFARVVLS